MANQMGKASLLRLIPVALLLAFGAGGVLLLTNPEGARRTFQRCADFFHAETSTPIVIATAGETGAYYRLGKWLQEGIAAQGYHDAEVLATAGSIDNLRRLRTGKAEFAFIQGGLSENLSGLAAVARVDRQYAHIIVPTDSPIKVFRDLAGKKVGAGPVDSGFEALGQLVFSYFDFDNAPVLVLDHGPDIERAFLDGRIDAMFTVYSLFAPAVESLLESGWYRLVPIDEAPAVARYLPGVYDETLPGDLYGPNRSIPGDGHSPFRTLAVDTLLVTREDVSGRRVQEVLDALYTVDFKRKAKLDGFTEAWGRGAGQLPYHTAAASFYRRNDPLSSDSFEIASFFLAGLVAVAGAAHYLLGARQRLVVERQRRAIMPYFELMLEYGRAVERAEEPEELLRLVHEMMSTQRQAEREWLAGRLHTEHMENLYSVYNLRSRNAFSALTQRQLERLEGTGTGTVDAASEVAEPAEAEALVHELSAEEEAFFRGRPAEAWQRVEPRDAPRRRPERKSAEAEEENGEKAEEDNNQMMLF